MRTCFNKSKLCLVAIYLLLTQVSLAQFNTGISPDIRTDDFVTSVGIGYFTDNYRPLARLHVNSNIMLPPFNNNFSPGNVFRTDGPRNVENNWTLFTGTSPYPYGRERFKLFVRANENIVRLQATRRNTVPLQVNNSAPSPSGALTFNVGDGEERVRITHTSNNNSEVFPNATRVGISITPNTVISPLTGLHIGENGLFNHAGHRLWMNVGTYYKTGVYDNMYVGLKVSEEFNNSDHIDAIINWGDNNYYVQPGPDARYLGDHLRFVFTANQHSSITGPQGRVNGAEVARFTPYGNMGIGNTFDSYREPVRRLEILEDGFVAGDQP